MKIKSILQNNPKFFFYFGGLLIFALAEVFYFSFGFYLSDVICCDMHILPLTTLKTNAWDSLFYSHTQPPFLSAMVALSLQIKTFFFNDFTVLDRIFAGYGLIVINHIFLLSAMLVFLRMMHQRNYSIYFIYALQIIMFSNPTIMAFLYYGLYTIFIYSFSIIVACLLFEGFLMQKPKMLVWSALTMVLMFLTYSIYSFALIIVFIIGLTLLYKGFKKKHYILLVLILTIPLAFTVKNYLIFGSIAQSSTASNSLYKMFYSRMPHEQIGQLVKEKKLSEIAIEHPFDGTYKNMDKYEKIGCEGKNFCEKHPVLIEKGYNNYGVLMISNVIAKDVSYLMKNNFNFYYDAVTKDALRIFFMPAVEYSESGFIYSPIQTPPGIIKAMHPLAKKGERLYLFSSVIVLVYGILLGYAVFDLIGISFRKNAILLSIFSIVFISLTSKMLLKNYDLWRPIVLIYASYFLILLILYLFGTLKFLIKNKNYDPQKSVLILTLGIIFYIFLVSILFEVGENMRFRMGADVFLLPLLLFFFADFKKYFPLSWIKEEISNLKMILKKVKIKRG